jgi:hypothetical protein
VEVIMKKSHHCLVGAGLALSLLLGTIRPSEGCIAIPREDPQQQDIKLPEQRAFLYSTADKTQHMVLSVKYEGAPHEFAWVIPTESQARVDVQSGAPFHELWKATTPRYPAALQAPGSAAMTRSTDAAAKRPDVQVLERKVAGPYDVAVLQARTSGGLYDWLKKNGFSTNATVRQALSSYVEKDWYFVAARIRPSKQGQVSKALQEGTIAPLHIAYKAKELSYPLRVTAGNPGTSKLELFVLGDKPPQHAGFTVQSFKMTPRQAKTFEVQGPPGTMVYQEAFPTLSQLIPRGGTLSKYTATLSAAERKRELVFSTL